MSFSSFLNIPDEVVRCIFTEWLIIVDIAKLDLSCCSHKFRSDFLTLAFKNTIYTCGPNIAEYSYYHEIVCWCVKRGVLLDGIMVTVKFTTDFDLHNQFLDLNGQSTRWIIFPNNLHDIANFGPIIRILNQVAKLCVNTEAVNLRGLRSVPTILCDYLYPLLTQRFQKLTDLSLECSKISSNALKRLLQRCHVLKKLCLDGLAYPVPVEVALPSLEGFAGWRCCIPHEVLLTIAFRCPRMKQLIVFRGYLQGGTEESLQAILQGCPRLERIDVEYARGISHELRVELARCCYFSHLAFTRPRWVGASATLVQRLLQVSPRLLELECGGARWLTDSVLETCAQHCIHLKSIKLIDCHYVSVAGIRALTGPGNILRMVVLQGCLWLCSDDAVLAVAYGCPQLREFHSPPQVSSKAIATLAKGCPLLEVVTVDGTRADDAAVAALAQHCGQLCQLSIMDCFVSESAVAALRQQHPLLWVFGDRQELLVSVFHNALNL